MTNIVVSDSSGWDMTEKTPQNRAVEELEQLGLREYEAKCFVSLTKITTGTAREVSEHIDVPRTRVYEAVRSLESEGLVEIQHGSPQRFRAIPIPEAVAVLEKRYQSRIRSLECSLEDLQDSTADSGPETDPEVWSLVGSDSITTRTARLVGEATEEVLFLVGDRQVVSDELTSQLVAASDRGVDIVVGTASESVRDSLCKTLPEEFIFDAELEWLAARDGQKDVSVGRLLLVDNSRLIASTFVRSDGMTQEQGICGNGASNSLIFTLRKLLSAHLGL